VLFIFEPINLQAPLVVSMFGSNSLPRVSLDIIGQESNMLTPAYTGDTRYIV